MRILQVAPFFSPQMGGSAHVAYQIARRLQRRGHQVTVVASDYASRESSFEDIPFRLLLFPTVLSARFGFYLTPGLLSWARANLSAFDLVHMHTTRTFQNAVVRPLATRRGVPYVLSAHGTLPIFMQRQSAKRLYDLLFGRALLARAACLLAVSPFEAEQYRQAGVEPARIQLTYNGLDLQEFDSLPPQGAFRSKLPGVGAGTKVVLFLGRVHAIKGIDLLIQAFARILAEGGEAVLVIAGPDEGEGARLQALAARLGLDGRVQFVGPLYGQDRLAALVDADLLASPASYEIFGLVPLEAIMCGTPVVVADSGGVGDLIREAHAGTVVPYGDVGALARALRRALGEPQESHRWVAAGQQFIRRNLDWNVIVDRLETVYAQVTAGRAG